MSKIQSLITLVRSLSYSEKKAFKIRSGRNKKLSDYLLLYEIIDKNPTGTKEMIHAQFTTENPNASFEIAGKYLFELLLETMLTLRNSQDSFSFLYKRIIHARILYEKSLIT